MCLGKGTAGSGIDLRYTSGSRRHVTGQLVTQAYSSVDESEANRRRRQTSLPRSTSAEMVA